MPLLVSQAEKAIELLSRLLGVLLPPVSTSYWALLMVLAAIIMAPLSAARAQREFGKGVIIAIAMGEGLPLHAIDERGESLCHWHGKEAALHAIDV